MVNRALSEGSLADLDGVLEPASECRLHRALSVSLGGQWLPRRFVMQLPARWRQVVDAHNRRRRRVAAWNYITKSAVTWRTR